MSAGWAWTVGVVCALMAVFPTRVTADDQIRRYGDGALSTDDFQATVPEQRDELDAVVHTRLHYDYKYRYRSSRTKFWLRCESVRCSAEILPQRSWMRSFLDPNLVDHEQGHFDLAEIAARRAQTQLDRLVQKRELSATGASLEKAEAALKKEIEAALKEFDVELRKANQAYDERTDHGRHRKIQLAERRSQQQMLAKLGREGGAADQDADDQPSAAQRHARPPLAKKTQ